MTVAVIPARYASTRFPGKPLALINGKPMVQHVVERCLEAQCFARVIVATDDERIAAVVRGFRLGEVKLTSPACASGTDRVAEVARQVHDEVYVNVQGDEPAIAPAALVMLARAFDDEAVQMATLVRALEPAERSNHDVVKVVLNERHDALYFSRADLPHSRDGRATPRWAHLGLYGYRREVLERLAGLAPTVLEQAEALEQLRALGHGIAIRCCVTNHVSVAVDRPEDVARAEAAVRALKAQVA